MPAVELSRLKIQIDGLIWRFTRPQEFALELHNIFSYYADRVYRPGDLVLTKHIHQAYHVPPLVTRQIELELRSRCEENPIAALTLADILWQESMLEPKLLAASLLGMLPSTQLDDVRSRIQLWSVGIKDSKVLKPMLEKSTTAIRRDQPEILLAVLKDWSASQDLPRHRLTAYLIQILLAETAFENIPPVFEMLTGILQSHSQPLQEVLLEVFRQLRKRSPAETAYFIRQTIRLGVSDAAASVLRKAIAEFDDPVRGSLLAEMRTEPAAENAPQETQ